MKEKRRNPRIPITLQLSICDLYKEQPIAGIHDLDSPIRLTDISLSGIAFLSECVLPVGYYFNATLDTLDHKHNIFTVVKIVRSSVLDHEQYLYGCEFTTPPENLSDFLTTIHNS